MDQIIAGMASFDAKFNGSSSWLLRYQQDRQMINPLPDDYQGRMPPSEIIKARKGEWLFEYEKQESLPINHDPPGTLVHRWSCWRKNICVERIDNNVRILPEPSVQAYQSFWFTQDLFLNTQKDVQFHTPQLRKIYGSGADSQQMWRMLPRGIEAHQAEFAVRPILEDVEGVLCHVLERSDRDIIWVDCSRGCSVCRRIYYQSPNSPLFETNLRGFREVNPGIWLPAKEVTIQYNLDTDPPNVRKKPKITRTNTLLECKFDNVPDSLFDVPKIQQGKVTDYVRGTTYVKYRKGINPFDEAVRLARLSLGRNQNSSGFTWLQWGLIALIGGNGVVLAVQLTGLIRRYRRNSS